MDDPWAMVDEAAGDRSSGAAQIATKAAQALSRLREDRVAAAIERLLRGHPSMAPLWRLASDILSSTDRVSAARRFALLLEGDRGAGYALVPHIAHRRLLTISHSSSIVELVRRAKPKAVLCMRSEPGGEGVRAAEVVAGWTAADVVEDEDAIKDVPGDVVVVGADAVTPNGVINKAKTRALVGSARAKAIPSHVVAGEAKFIGSELPVGAGFEVTPLVLFVSVAGPEGVLDAKSAEARARARPLHQALHPLLEDLLKRGG